MSQSSPWPTSWRGSPGRCCSAGKRLTPMRYPWPPRDSFGRSESAGRASGVCERVKTRWPDSQTALRKPGVENGARRRRVYEDRGARISILAGRRPPRPDTLKQTDQPPNLDKTPCRRGGPYVQPKDGSGSPPSDRNGETDFRKTERSNATHAATTDKDARLSRKAEGQESRLADLGPTLMENRNGLIVAADATLATGTAEREAAATFSQRLAQGAALAADRKYALGAL